MKKMKPYILTAGFLLLASGIFAQRQDSLLRRQMELEREFNPSLMDANKINSLPALQQPTIKKANTAFSSWAERAIPSLEIALPQPGNAMTEIPYDTKKGYAGISAGNNANIDGIFGYRLLENKTDKLNFFFRHNSTNSNVDYVQDSSPKSNKLSAMDNLGELSYEHLSDALKFDIGASYLHSIFNYYGNTFSQSRIFENEKQRLGVFNLNAGFQSVENNDFRYKVFVDFKNFSTKFGQALTDDGLSGNQIDAALNVEKPFQQGSSSIGLDGSVFGAFYSAPSSSEYADNVFLLTATPYIRFKGDNWDAKLGIKGIIQIADKNKYHVTPDIQLSANVSDRSSLYANIGGGVDNNSFLDVMNESRYVQPLAYVQPSFSQIDLEVGAKIGEVDGFRFDVFGGFKRTSDEHFLLLRQTLESPTGLPAAYRNDEFLNPFYAKLSHSFIGGRIQSNIWSPLNISLGLKKNFYSMGNMAIDNAIVTDAKAFNKPGFEADINATFEATAKLKFMLNYYLAADRWSYFNAGNVKMDNINDLNLGVEYRFNYWLSANLKATNMLMQKYDVWYGFPTQGISIMGGITVKF